MLLHADQQSPYLVDARQRFHWAEDACEAFAGASAWFAQPETYAIRTQLGEDRWESTFHRWIREELEAEKLTELAGILGAFLDHVRAGLDYLAYQLALLAREEGAAVQGGDPQQAEYPICRSAQEFRHRHRIASLTEEQRGFIEAQQPYPGRDPSLWLLHELWTAYRRRVLRLVAIVPVARTDEVLVDGARLPASDVEILEHERLEQDAPLLRFALPASAGRDAHVDPELVTTVAIDHPACAGTPARSVLDAIMAAAGGAFLDIEERFFLD